MSTTNKQKIDTQKLLPMLSSIGWTRADAEQVFMADFSSPVSPDVKRDLWDCIKITQRWKPFFPSAKVTSMTLRNPGNGGGS